MRFRGRRGGEGRRIFCAGPFGSTDELLKDLKGKLVKDLEIKIRAIENDKGV